MSMKHAALVRNRRVSRWRMSTTFLALLSCHAGLLSTHAAAPAQESEDPWSRERLDALLAPVFINKMADYYVAGAAVAVVKDGQLAYMRGFGYSDIFAQKRVDPDRTIFRIGSVTKTMTGVALLQLVDRGLVDLEADVNHYLTDFRIEENDFEPIRVKHLLSHTAGFDQFGYGRHATSEDTVIPMGKFLEDDLVRLWHLPLEAGRNRVELDQEMQDTLRALGYIQ